MLSKEFAPYEESLELRELGFDEPCFGKYDIYGVFDHKLFYHNHDADTILNCSAPTFSQAFRWFREKHKMVFNLISSGDYNYPSISFMNIDGDSEIELGEFESYEEAELACLRKLIEIVKGK